MSQRRTEGASREARTRGPDLDNPLNKQLLRPKRRRGRPSLYHEGLLPRVREMALGGATNEEIAADIGVTVATLYAWQRDIPNFVDALKPAKAVADQRVENALYKSAMEGSNTAQIFWLKNRRPNEWRDKRDIEVGGELKTDIDDTRRLGLAVLALLQDATEHGEEEPLTIEGEFDATG